MDGEWLMIWKEVIVEYLKVLTRYSRLVNYETTKNLITTANPLSTSRIKAELHRHITQPNDTILYYKTISSNMCLTFLL
jgi:hypothetical protein